MVQPFPIACHAARRSQEVPNQRKSKYLALWKSAEHQISFFALEIHWRGIVFNDSEHKNAIAFRRALHVLLNTVFKNIIKQRLAIYMEDGQLNIWMEILDKVQAVKFA